MTTHPAQSPPSAGQGVHEPCEECGAPLDPQQRYCVRCAARRRSGANPSSQYFAAMSKRAHRPPARAQGKAGAGTRAAAVAFFALLPVAVGIGVLVGRSGGGDDEALLQALREQRSAAVAAAPSTAEPTAAGGKGAKSAGRKAAGGGKVLAKTKNGSVHQVTGFEPTRQKEEEDTELVESNVRQSGATYIKAQQNLPDVIVVGGDPDEAPALPTGSQP